MSIGFTFKLNSKIGLCLSLKIVIVVSPKPTEFSTEWASREVEFVLVDCDTSALILKVLRQ
jgi:hypothetical protein